MKNGKIRTYPIKSLTIFLSICFVVSVGMIVLFSLPFMAKEQWIIRILIWVFCSIFALASGIVLFNQLFYYVEVKEDVFIKHEFLIKKKVKFQNIQRIKNVDGFYEIYVNNRRFASFTANTFEAQQMIVYMEKNKVKIDW